MSEQFHRRMHSLLRSSKSTEGKITIFTSLVACLVLVCAFTVFYNVGVPVASADNVTSSVTVLNTPPTWTVDAQESAESSTSTPTNAGQVLSFVGTASDSSNDNYYLLICSNNSAPTAHSGAAPTCNGAGTTTIAVSASTASGAQATAATTTTELFAEKTDWWAWICDNNAGLARCNATSKQGTGTTASPFVVNHPPVFTGVWNDSPKNPGQLVTWSATSTDSDSIRGGDKVTLYLCKTAAFNGTSCTGGFWSSSTPAVLTNPTATTSLAIPYQDKVYSAFAYVSDSIGLSATSTQQGSASNFTVSNVSPTISAALISVIDTDGSGDLTLLRPAATTSGFKVQFTVADNNGCQNSTSSNEIAGNIMAVYRSGVTQANCNSAGNYDSNNCYAATSTLFTPYYTCTQDALSCSGVSDSDATFTCTFSLWFNADATDLTSKFPAQNWLASVRATDDNGATSAFVESSTGNDLDQFLAFAVSTTTVAYGALQPGDTTTPLVANTDLHEQGNTGLDENLYGSTMCTTWVSGGGSSNPDNCDVGGVNAGTKIPVFQQVVSTTTSPYDTAAATSSTSGKLMASTSPTSIAIHVPKTTATSSIQTRDTYWGIAIPTAIALSGNYNGQNTIIGVASNSSNW